MPLSTPSTPPLQEAPPAACASPATLGDRIPLFQKVMFAAGMNTDYIATGLMTNILWMPFFNIGLGMNPAVLGGILMLLRLWEAIIDPLMGNLSDNTRSKLGRRRPYLYLGAITTALLYPFLWTVPMTWGETSKVLYLAIIGIFFFTAFTSWSIPYYSMQLELTPNYDERTRLTGWMTFFSKLSYLAGGWMLSFVILVGTIAMSQVPVAEGGWFAQKLLDGIAPLISLFPAAGPDERPIVAGMRIVAPLIAASILCFGLLPALFVKEPYYSAKTSKQEKESLWQSIKESMHSPPLWALNGTAFFLLLGTASVATLGQYVNFYYVCQGDLALGALIAGWKGTLVVIIGVSTIPIFIWLGEKYDKRAIVLAMIASSMGGHLLNYFLMTPEHPYLQIISGTFESCSLSAVWLFLPSMKADVADWDELQTSRRREGAINAFHYWFIKMALTLSMGIGGVALYYSGFNSEVKVQGESVLHWMFSAYLILPIVFWSLAFLIVWVYPLTRAQAVLIRQQLETRRGAA